MSNAPAPLTLPVEPTDWIEIVDALYRYSAGLDLNDRGLFESALSETVRIDLADLGRTLGLALPILEGRTAATNTLLTTASLLDTTHTVTNPRITAYDGASATLSALVEAQHVLRDEVRTHLLLKGIYTADLSHCPEGWRIARLRIETVWMTGDTGVLFGGVGRPLAVA